MKNKIYKIFLTKPFLIGITLGIIPTYLMSMNWYQVLYSLLCIRLGMFIGEEVTKHRTENVVLISDDMNDRGILITELMRLWGKKINFKIKK